MYRFISRKGAVKKAISFIDSSQELLFLTLLRWFLYKLLTFHITKRIQNIWLLIKIQLQDIMNLMLSFLFKIACRDEKKNLFTLFLLNLYFSYSFPYFESRTSYDMTFLQFYPFPINTYITSGYLKMLPYSYILDFKHRIRYMYVMEIEKLFISPLSEWLKASIEYVRSEIYETSLFSNIISIYLCHASIQLWSKENIFRTSQKLFNLIINNENDL